LHYPGAKVQKNQRPKGAGLKSRSKSEKSLSKEKSNANKTKTAYIANFKRKRGL
jgi:hypothetical protein